MPSWLNLANLLTLLRLALTPFVIRGILAGDHIFALVLFAIAAVTDVLDGAAARYFALGTRTGAYLDPIADKCLLSGVYLALAMAGTVPLWFVGVVFGRDLYILLAVGVLMLCTPQRKFSPSLWGKISTFVQIVTAVAILSRNSGSNVLLWPCAAFTIWSGIHYTLRSVQEARAH